MSGFRVDVIKPEELWQGQNPVILTSFYPRLLADGDSWCSLGSVPAKNLPRELTFPTQGIVVNCAHPGYTVNEMNASVTQAGRVRMRDWVARLGEFIEGRGIPQFDAILLSGGGNDLIDAVPTLLAPGVDPGNPPADPAQLIDAAKLEAFEDRLLLQFTEIIEFIRERGGVNAALPIFLHTYDYPTPNPSPATIFGIPVGKSWLYPSVRHLPVSTHGPLASLLLDRLAATLQELGALSDVHVVNTLNTVVPAESNQTGESGDWENEIHLTKAGYGKVAAKMAARMRQELNF